MADQAATSTQTTSTENKEKQTEPQLQPHKARYKVTTFSLYTKDQKYADQNGIIELNPVCIKRLFIIQDFDQFLQPVIQMDVLLPALILDYMREHRDEISFIIRIDIVDFISAGQNQKFDANDYKENGSDILCNAHFVTFMPDNMKTPNLGEYKEVAAIQRGDDSVGDDITKCGQNMANYKEESIFFIWKEHDVYTLRKQVNAVYSSVTIGDAASSMLSDNGFEKVLIAPSDNTETFGQLIIPPMTMMNVFRFLQNQYGMYNTDVLFFNDIWRCYVIDRSGECKAHEDNEYTKTIFSVVDSRSEYSKDTGTSTLDEKFEYHMKLDIMQIAVRSLSSINDVITGNTAMYIDSRNNEVTTVSGAGDQRGEGCVNVTTDHEGTQYTKSKHANNVSELAMNLKVTGVKDYNYTALSPNKAFVFNFKNKDFYKYNGYYRLMKATHILTREGNGDQMGITGIFEFTRKKELAEEERKTIDYDVFRTAQVTEEGKEQAASQAEENTAKKDPSYAQSENNKIAEGKMEAPEQKSPQGPSAPSTVGSAAPNKTSTVQPFNPDTSEGYKKQEADRNKQVKNNPESQGGGPKAPRPLNKK